MPYNIFLLFYYYIIQHTHCKAFSLQTYGVDKTLSYLKAAQYISQIMAKDIPCIIAMLMSILPASASPLRANSEALEALVILLRATVFPLACSTIVCAATDALSIVLLNAVCDVTQASICALYALIAFMSVSENVFCLPKKFLIYPIICPRFVDKLVFPNSFVVVLIIGL